MDQSKQVFLGDEFDMSTSALPTRSHILQWLEWSRNYIKFRFKFYAKKVSELTKELDKAKKEIEKLKQEIQSKDGLIESRFEISELNKFEDDVFGVHFNMEKAREIMFQCPFPTQKVTFTRLLHCKNINSVSLLTHSILTNALLLSSHRFVHLESRELL